MSISKFGIKLFLFASLVFVAHTILVLNVTVLQDDDEMLNQIDAVSDPSNSIYFLGDSVIDYTTETDTDLRSVVEILDQQVPRVSVIDIAQPAQHPVLQKKYVDYFLHAGHSPKLVILPINLKVFSPFWDQRPTYQFYEVQFLAQAQKNRLVRVFLRPFVVFNAFDLTWEQRRFDAQELYYQDEYLGKMKEFEPTLIDTVDEELIRKMWLLYYGTELDGQHRQLKALKRIQDKLEQQEIPLLFYITPFDYQRGTSTVTDDFDRMTHQQIQVLSQELESKTTKLINWGQLFETDKFDWIYSPNSHLHQNGRIELAEKLKEEIESF